MASTKVQLEELKKPDPRYVLELHTIRGMIQEADCMDKGLRAVLGIRSQAQMMPHGGTSSAPQPPPQPPSVVTPAPFAPSIPPNAPPLQPHRKKPSQVQAAGAVLVNPAGMNSVQSCPIFTQSAGAMQIRRPTLEEVIAAKRWVDEQKRIAFSRGSYSLVNLLRL